MGFLIIFMAEEYFTLSLVCACSMRISCLQDTWREKKGAERTGKRRRSHGARWKVGAPAHPVACCSHAWVVAPSGCALWTGHSLIRYHKRTRPTESLNRPVCPPTSSCLSSPSFASATRNRKGHSENLRKPPASPGSALLPLHLLPGVLTVLTVPTPVAMATGPSGPSLVCSLAGLEAAGQNGPGSSPQPMRRSWEVGASALRCFYTDFQLPSLGLSAAHPWW